MPPLLVDLASEDEYRQHYEDNYCTQTIHTFDGIRVYFGKFQFDDAFYESVDRRARDKSTFSFRRARRIAWIRAALEEASAELFCGWDRDKKQAARDRRVALVYQDYVVVIKLKKGGKKAIFITAYVADEKTIRLIKSGPRWS